MVKYNYHFTPDISKTTRIPTSFGIGERKSQGVLLKHLLETPHARSYLPPTTNNKLSFKFGLRDDYKER